MELSNDNDPALFRIPEKRGHVRSDEEEEEEEPIQFQVAQTHTHTLTHEYCILTVDIL